MNDRLRFRVWVFDCAVQSYMTDMYIGYDGQLYYKDSAGMEKITSDRWTFEQCTGQKDQAGKLIFEGDVVSVYNPLADAWYDCVVAWEPEAAGYVCRYLEPDKVVRGCAYASKEGTYFEGASCRVIGNIHEWKGGEK